MNQRLTKSLLMSALIIMSSLSQTGIFASTTFDTNHLSSPTVSTNTLQVNQSATLQGLHTIINNPEFPNGYENTTGNHKISVMQNYVYGFIVYPNGTNFYEKNETGAILFSSPVPETVIQDAINRNGDVYVANGTYNLSPSFSGITITNNEKLFLAQHALLRVPSGYTGAVFTNINGLNYADVQGGYITEQSPIKYNWVGIELNNTAYFNKFHNMYFNATGTGIRLDYDPTKNINGYTNANYFEDITFSNYKIGIDFNQLHQASVGGHGANQNTFRDLVFETQMANITTNGTRNICCYNEQFYNVQLWDIQSTPNAWYGNIQKNASYTEIVGGFMTYSNSPTKQWGDAGTNTQIFGTCATCASNKLTAIPSVTAVLNLPVSAYPVNPNVGDFGFQGTVLQLRTNTPSTVTVVDTSQTQKMINKQFDSSNLWEDATDNTKRLFFNLLSIPTGHNITPKWTNLNSTISERMPDNATALGGTYNSTAIGQTELMVGNNVTITPILTGNVMVSVAGDIQQSSSSTTACRIDVRNFTASSDGAGRAVLGTVQPSSTANLKVNTNALGTTSADIIPWSMEIKQINARVNQKELFDTGLSSLGAGTCTITNEMWHVWELP